MDKNLVKKLFDRGVILNCEIFESPVKQNCWNIMFKDNTGGTVILSDSRGKGDKSFAQIQNAIRTVNEIGFKNVRINMPTPMGKVIPKPEDFKLG